MTAPASSVLLLKRLLGTIPAVPLDLTQLASTSISALIKAGRALLFTEVKLELWNALVSTTADAERSVCALS